MFRDTNSSVNVVGLVSSAAKSRYMYDVLVQTLRFGDVIWRYSMKAKNEG